MDDCVNFWLCLIPYVMAQLQDDALNASTVKALCYETLSNIGVHVYEKLPVIIIHSIF